MLPTITDYYDLYNTILQVSPETASFPLRLLIISSVLDYDNERERIPDDDSYLLDDPVRLNNICTIIERAWCVSLSHSISYFHAAARALFENPDKLLTITTYDDLCDFDKLVCDNYLFDE